MGLDMYIEKETRTGFDNDENVEIKREEMYWRKANQIHNWFVKNVQNGVDDFGRYEIKTEILIKLYDDCTKAYFQKDPDVFPPIEGFFFGSTDIDEYYWEDILDTLRWVKPIALTFRRIAEKVAAGEELTEDEKIMMRTSYFYRASW
jgi:hypothetical protein